MIEAMLSSTIMDLLGDRTTALSVLEDTSLVKVKGALPVSATSRGSSSFIATLDMAESCDLYILLMGHRYGYITEHNKSATELEFDAAYRENPTKILVFIKDATRTERRQRQFIDQVRDYHKGYYVSTYRDTGELADVVLESFTRWLTDRAAIGPKLNYFDHFIHLAIQRVPFPGVRPSYTVAEDHLELRYRIMSRTFAIQFAKSEIYQDFWGCFVALEKRFEEWRRNRYGGSP